MLNMKSFQNEQLYIFQVLNKLAHKWKSKQIEYEILVYMLVDV